MSRTLRRRPTAVYAETAVLDPEQLAAALGVDVDRLEDFGFPVVELGPRTRRYVWRQVLAVLEKRATDSLVTEAA